MSATTHARAGEETLAARARHAGAWPACTPQPGHLEVIAPGAKAVAEATQATRAAILSIVGGVGGSRGLAAMGESCHNRDIKASGSSNRGHDHRKSARTITK